MKLSLVIAFGLLMYAAPSLTQQRPVVLELFTSQGCSSCPLADRILSTLSKRDNIITLSCHVTYWNYLGWRDTLSLSGCDKRQSRYQQYLRSSSNYTPQLVVNGYGHAVGSQIGKVEALIKKAGKQQPLKPLKLSLQQNQLSVQIAPLASNTRFIELFYLAKSHEQSIGRGENAGRKIVYTRPVLKIQTIDYSDSKAPVWRFAIDAPPRSARLLVLIKNAQWQLMAAGEAAL